MPLNESSACSALDIKIKEEPGPLVETSNVKEEVGTVKTSNEILSELFSAFNAEPPVIAPILPKDVKSEKHVKHKKKHKHKDKKKKRKLLKTGRSSSDESSENDTEHKHKHKKAKKSSHDKKKILDSKHHSDEKLVKNDKTSTEITTTIINPDIPISNVVKTDEHKNSDDVLLKSSVTNKITIKSLKFSTVFETNVRIAEEQARMKAEQYEDGELSETNEQDSFTDTCKDSSSHSHHKSRHRHETKEDKYSDHHKERYKSHNSRSRSHIKSRSRSKDRRRSRSREKRMNERSSRHADNNSTSRRYHDSRSEKKLTSSYKNHHRSKTRSRSRSKSRSRTSSSHLDIDKKRLLAIARKNAIHMLKCGALPGAASLCKQDQEKVMAAIKSGGKSIEELTDFCKNLSQNEELGELSSVSSGDSDHEDDGSDKLFHHPFVIKDRGAIVMNIKNSVPIPTKTLQEKTAEQVKSLRMLFPVSSGTDHRKTENEWVPVSPSHPPLPSNIKLKKDTMTPELSQVDFDRSIEQPNFREPQHTITTAIANIPNVQSNFIAPPPAPPSSNQVFNTDQSTNMDISAIISQRLIAMRRLQENPTDAKAMNEMYHAQQNMSVWASSKYEPGQFTGSTGANILSARELQSGTQAWAKRDQLQKAAPVSGGMGMHLLQKMGWRPGEGLGKDKSGSLQPLMLEVKLDKKGLVANEEAPQRNGKQNTKKATVFTLAGKHPVSLLGEYASKRKLGAPCYELCFESGPDHKKNFLFKVKLNGIEYQPSIASINKKQAKADAAMLCLQKLGVLPTT